MIKGVPEVSLEWYCLGCGGCLREYGASAQCLALGCNYGSGRRCRLVNDC